MTNYSTADRISPLHLPTNYDLVAQIEASMEQEGWLGNPVLILTEDTNEYQAITGSHRIEAAVNVGIEIPYLALDLSDEILCEILEARDDEDRLALIEEHSTDQDAIRIMAEEVENNYNN